MKTNTNNLSATPTTLEEATGNIPFKMTNDYMFRALLQKNQAVLEGLICSLLHLDKQEVKSAIILNPIELGDSVIDKEFRLDVLVELNSNEKINLEMQVNNLHDWPNRSLAYLCRTYAKLEHGESYLNIKPAIHIGFLDYTLFEDAPEFYATYKMLNVKSHYVYNSNFVISVVDLTRIDLATAEDSKYEIDTWARLFKASTWDELKRIAGDNIILKGAASTMYDLSNDYLIQKKAQDRQDYLDYQRYAEEAILKWEKAQISLAEKDEMLSEKDEMLSEKDEMLSEKDEMLSEKDEMLSEKDEIISEKDEMISTLVAEIEKLRTQIKS